MAPMQRRAAAVAVLLWAVAADAATVMIPGEAHGHTAILTCGIGGIAVSQASYGGYVIPATSAVRGAVLSQAAPSIDPPPLADSRPAPLTCRNYAAAAAGGTCDNGGLSDCHCQCGAGHDNPAGAIVDVLSKVAPVCDGLKTCEFPVCWMTGAGAPADCAKPTAIALGDPCLKCKKDFEVGFDCTWGWSFLFVVVPCVGLYLGGGWALNHRSKGLGGLDALPHSEHWRGIAGLAKDGVRFAQARAGGRRGYTPVAAAAAAEQQSRSSADREDGDWEKARDRGGSSSAHEAKRSKRSKEGKKSSSKKASSSGSKGGDVKAAATSGAAPAEEPAAPPAADAAASTASGGGGRWVHVPT
eukprot:COSAG06_NODE_829_length_12043_cov_8.656983_13_plen_356_part_00